TAISKQKFANVLFSDVPQYVKDHISSDASKKVNIFEWWLKSKRFELQKDRKNITTRKRYLLNFS
ncbi:MAG: hypothetical protein C0412_21020, partial [Flavobacterium sp.]|nr:hypothetical protein [Flavobacterium sp.]